MQANIKLSEMPLACSQASQSPLSIPEDSFGNDWFLCIWERMSNMSIERHKYTHTHTHTYTEHSTLIPSAWDNEFSRKPRKKNMPPTRGFFANTIGRMAPYWYWSAVNNSPTPIISKGSASMLSVPVNNRDEKEAFCAPPRLLVVVSFQLALPRSKSSSN